MEMVKTVVRIWPLFFGLLLIGLAAGVQGTLLGVRAELEGFPASLIGFLMSCYFAGFLVGSLLAPRMIQRVGHIRMFAALTAMASVTILVHSVFVEPWTWAAMRFLTGFAFSAIYVVSESWLNQAATNETRGQILAIYMTILLAGLCTGQFMLQLADPAGFSLFILISVMVSVAAVPILMTDLQAPPIQVAPRVKIALLWQRTPMGVMGIILAQWTASVVFGMGAVYAVKLGMNIQQVAWFMGSIMAGGMVVQWPLGKLSDHVDRRWVMGVSSLIAMTAAIIASFVDHASTWLYVVAFIFGGFSLSLYSLVVALTNDYLRPSEIVPASGTVILIAGLTSVTGPLTASFWMQLFGTQSFFLVLATCLLLLAVISIWRAMTIPAVPPEFKTHSTLQAAATPVGVILHAEEEVLAQEP